MLDGLVEEQSVINAQLFVCYPARFVQIVICLSFVTYNYDFVGVDNAIFIVDLRCLWDRWAFYGIQAFIWLFLTFEVCDVVGWEVWLAGYKRNLISPAFRLRDPLQRLAFKPSINRDFLLRINGSIKTPCCKNHIFVHIVCSRKKYFAITY